MKKLSFFVCFVVVVSSTFAQLVKIDGIPRDTSFTPYSAWIKAKKQYPQVQVVKPVLPENVKATMDVVYTTIPYTKYG